MQSSHLKLFSPIEIQKSNYLKKINDFTFKPLGSAIYILDWVYLFEQIDIWKINNKRIALMMDIGCGNGMFHIFLEKYYKQGIIGIERQDSTNDYERLEKLGHYMVNSTDICIDFIEEGNDYFNEKIDIVFWISAIEHNEIEEMKKAVEVSMKALKKGGIFVSTWAFGKKTHWNNSINATVLSEEDAEIVFNAKWLEKPNFDKIANQYKENCLNLKEWHEKRFKNDEIDYLHAGNVLIKS